MAPPFDFNAFRKKTLLLSRRIQPRATAASAIEPIFAPLLQKAHTVSFDVFDTLTARIVYHPVDVFQFLAAHPAFQALDLAPDRNVAEYRAEAEQRAYAWMRNRMGNPNSNLREIYQVFCQRLGLDPALAETLALAEEDVELDLAQANEEGQVLFNDVVRSGKPIVILSDTYHRPEFIGKLLAHCGYQVRPEQIYSSSHRRMAKYEGKLFVFALRELDLPPEALLHVGDNGHADQFVPARLGIATFWHPFRAYFDALPDYAAEAGDLHSQVKSLTERARMPRRQPDDFWFQLGYRVTGPLLTGFSLWLRRRFEADQVDRGYFLLRDGLLLHRVYDIVAGDRSPCPVRTLPASRRAMVFPSLEIDIPLVLQNLLSARAGDSRPVGSYLRRFDLDPARFEKEIAAVGLVGSQHVIDGGRVMDKVAQLFTQPAVVQAIVEKAWGERELLLAYLKQEGLADPGHAGLVDLGWYGSIQKALHGLFQSREIGTRLTGYYVGTRTGFTESLHGGLSAFSYAFHSGRPRKLAQAVTANCEVIENMCSSTDGSLHSFRRQDGRIVPLFDETSYPEEYVRNVNAMHDGTAEFAQAFKKRMARYGWDAIPVEIAIENLVRLTTNPTSEEAVRLGAVVHDENLGTNQGHPLAVFRPESSEPADLWEDYKSAYWKPGLLNQPTAQAAQLRLLLWLMQDVHPELREALSP
jgi:FMN phosphatase YigB (HAD superfamily)